MLVRLCRSGVYEPKKTACFCLGNLLRDHPRNQQKAVSEGSVTLLTELINDEEDDELSKKAYECLELMGDPVIEKHMELIKRFSESRKGVTWNQQKTIIVDVFGKKERHVIMRKNKDTPSVRHFGPQDEDDLLDQVQLVSLEKILPVLNGLIY